MCLARCSDCGIRFAKIILSEFIPLFSASFFKFIDAVGLSSNSHKTLLFTLFRQSSIGLFPPGLTIRVGHLSKVDTLSIEWLKHLKEDANAPQEEIDAIPQPKLL